MNNAGFILCEDTGSLTKPTIIDKQDNTTKMKVTLQTAGDTNRNNRVYSKEALQSGIDTEYFQELLKNKALYGEAGHPITKDPKRAVAIDLGNVSHIITSVSWENSSLKGIIETANTRVGRDMKGLADQGSKLGFSVRALGPITESEGKSYLNGPLKIITYDWVMYPSHRTAYMEGIVNESSDILTPSLEEMGAMALQESVELPVSIEQHDLLDVLMYESANFHTVKNFMEFEDDELELTLNESGDLVYMNGANGKRAIARVEEYAQMELDNLMREINR